MDLVANSASLLDSLSQLLRINPRLFPANQHVIRHCGHEQELFNHRRGWKHHLRNNNHLIFSQISTTNIHFQQHKDFDWNSKERGLILGSFFWGYVTTQIIGGFLAPKIGAARLIGLSAFCTSILALSTPLAASNGGLIPLMILRLFQGVFQGVFFPAQMDLFSYWVPPVERTRLVTIAYSGIHIGTFLTMTLCGIISQYLGWKWIFYLSGTSSIIWCLLWAWQIYEQPSKDPFITAEERNYILSSIGPLRRVKVINTTKILLI